MVIDNQLYIEHSTTFDQELGATMHQYLFNYYC